MAKINEQKVVLVIDNVRVVKTDELNFSVEKFIIAEKNGEKTEKWAHKGYAGSLKNALLIIIKRELLLPDSHEGLQQHLEQVQIANAKIERYLAKQKVES